MNKIHVIHSFSGEAKPVASDEAPEAAPEPEEEGPKEMTLDEWKAQQKGTKTQSDFKIRRPGEGCDDTQWKKMYVLKKKVVNEGEESEEEEDEVG